MSHSPTYPFENEVAILFEVSERTNTVITMIILDGRESRTTVAPPDAAEEVTSGELRSRLQVENFDNLFGRSFGTRRVALSVERDR